MCFETVAAHTVVYVYELVVWITVVCREQLYVLYICVSSWWFLCKDSPSRGELWGPMGTEKAESLLSQQTPAIQLGKDLLSSLGTQKKELL